MKFVARRFPASSCTYGMSNGGITKIIEWKQQFFHFSFLETNFVKFPTVNEAQDVLELCIQFPNLELLSRAVSFLDFHISHSVIALYRLLKSSNNNVCLPSPTKTRCCKAAPTNLTTSDHYIAALQENSLCYIDKHAEEVFKQQEILELRFEELSLILNRPTLELSSELILIDLLANWSWRQCEKRRMEITEENRRSVLGALCYTPRYLAMPSKHFSQAFERVHLLDGSEEDLVQNVYKGKKTSGLTTEQVKMIDNFKRHRPYNKVPRLYHLSDRSHPKKSRRAGTDYYAKRKCSFADCLYFTFCICFN